MASFSDSQFPTGDSARDERILDRYFAGESSVQERALVDAWLSNDETRRIRGAAIRHAIRYPITTKEVPDMSAIWSNLRSRIENDLESQVPIESRRETSEHSISSRRIVPRATLSRSRTFWSVCVGAVTAVAIIGVGQMFQTTWTTKTETKLASIYSTNQGERATITLPDSTTIFLNVASRLEIPTDYSRTNRTIRLDGEALFSVSHHVGTPFTVIAGESRTRVLGTRFAVRRYASDSAATIAVRDGKVAVQEHVVTANQQAIVRGANPPVMMAASPGQFTFEHGILTLPPMSLADATNELNRWYDADIILSDPRLASRRIRGEFVAGSPAELANILELALNIRVVRVGRNLTLYPRESQ